MNNPKVRLSPVFHLTLVSSIILVVWGYWPGWVDIVHTWMSDPDYNHGFIVIPVSIWLIWQRKDELLQCEISPSWWGLVLICIAGAVRMAGAEYFIEEFDTWSIPFWVGGVVLLFGGWKIFRLTAGSIAFLWFMTPLPATVTMMLSMPLQKVSAAISTWSLHLFAQPAVRQGTTIILGDQVLEVERACSGLRICYGIFALAVGYVLLKRPGLFRSGLVLLMAIPVAILANSVRVTGTGLLFLVVSGKEAHDYSHDFAGFVMLPLAVMLFAGANRAIEKFGDLLEESRRAAFMLMAKIAVALVVIGAILGWWQQRQATAGIANLILVAEKHEKVADDFKAKADQRSELNELTKALAYLDRYCQIRPDDVEGSRQFAEVAERLALGRGGALRAARGYERLWSLLPSDNELGMKMIEFAVLGRDFDLAIRGANQLLGTNATSEIAGTADRGIQERALKLLLQALTLKAEQTSTAENWDELAESLKLGLTRRLSPVLCAFQLANLYRTQSVLGLSVDQREQQSNQVIEELVTERPEDPLAWFARYSFYQKYPITEVPGEASNSEASAAAEPTDDLDRAVKLAKGSKDPDTLVIWLSAGERAMQRNQAELAREYFNSAIEINPAHYLAYLQLSRLDSGLIGDGVREVSVSQEQHEAAIKTLQRGLERPELGRELLLKAELLRHQVSLVDKNQAGAAVNELIQLREELSKLPKSVGLPLSLELSVVEAESHARSGDLTRAVSILEAMLRTNMLDGVEISGAIKSSAWGRLGSYYEKQGRRDQASFCFQKSASFIANPVDADLMKAVDAERQNRREEAANMYLEIARRQGNSPEAWLGVARTALYREIGKPAAARDFSDFTLAFEKAKEAGATSQQIAVLEATFNEVLGQFNNAIETLEAAAKEAPESADLWRSLAVLRQNNGDIEGSNAAVAEFERNGGGKVETALLKAELFGRKADWESARTLLSQLLNDVKELEMRRQLFRQLWQIEVMANNPDAALDWLKSFADEQPQDLPAQLFYAEYLLLREQYDVLTLQEDRLRKLEGEAGANWKEFRSRRLVDQALKTSDLAERRKLKSEAESLTALLSEEDIGKSRLESLRGRLKVLDGDYAAASEHFEAAWGSGTPDERLAVELISSLRLSGKAQFIELYAEQMRDIVALSPRVFDLLLESGSKPAFLDIARGSEIAKQFLKREPGAASHLRIARIYRLFLELSGDARRQQLDEIESAYRTAIQLNPADPQARGELLLFRFRELQDIDSVFRELDLILKDSALTELDRSFVAAQLLSEIGLDQQAMRFWDQAVVRSDSAADSAIKTRVFRIAAEFYLRKNREKASSLLKRAMSSSQGDAAVVLQYMATLLDQDTKASLTEAADSMDSLESVLQSAGNVSLHDATRRLGAMILLRGVNVAPDSYERSVSLKRAAEFLSSIQIPESDDRVRSASVSLAQGEKEKSLRALQEATESVAASTFALRVFVEACQDHGGEDETLQRDAENVIVRLESEPETMLVALQLRLRSGSLTPEDSLQICEKFVLEMLPRLRDEAQRVNGLQGVLEYLLQRNLPSVCERFITSEIDGLPSGDRVRALVLLAIRRQDFSDQFGTKLDAVVKALVTDSADKQLKRIVADYHFMRANWKEAEEFYTQIVKSDSTDFAAANNLALVLAEEKSRAAEALQLVKSAFKSLNVGETLSPRNSFLFDTEAQVLMANGKPEEALAILQPLCESSMADASAFLHFASCLDRMGRSEDAAAAFRQAVLMGVSDAPMAPADRRMFAELSSQYPVL